MSTPRTAIVIEDDEEIRQLVRSVLEMVGYNVIGTSNGADGVNAVQAYQPEVTTIDVNMPGIDGFETAKRIRAISNSYIIMLTARDEEIDILQGLGSGADDYLVKPFRTRELRARVEALLRRPREHVDAFAPERKTPAASAPVVEDAPLTSPVPAAPYEATPAEPDTDEPQVASPAAHVPIAVAPGQSEHNGVILDASTRIVTVLGSEVDLTRSEFDLLQVLFESGRRVRTKTDLALALRGERYVTTHYVSDADRRGVEVHIANLRKKIGDNPAQPRVIETVRGVGYRLTAPLE